MSSLKQRGKLIGIGRRVSPALIIGILAFFPIARTATNEVALRLIILDSEAEAQRTREQLRRGADFAVVARQKSVDPTSLDGGYMGTVAPETLRPELQKALHGIGPGQITNVVQMARGFAILKVLPPDEVANLQKAEKDRQFAVSSLGAIRYSPDISGINETETALANFLKPGDWNRDPASACEARELSVESVSESVETFLKKHASDADPGQEQAAFDKVQVLIAAGEIHAYRGEMDQAVEQWERAYRLSSSSFPKAVNYMHETLGVGYLHKSEMDNGVYRNPGERCLFPMPASARYAKPASSEKAIEHFLAYLEQKPDELEVKWLLNVSYMTIGRYPEGVPKQYLLPASAFSSAEDIGRFKDVAPEAGLNAFSMAGGLIVDDFDNDGLLDVVMSSFYMCAPLRLFHNNGDGTFTDRTDKAGLAKQLGGLNIVQTDYNNDGCLDILVLRGGWEIAQRKSLLRNNCDGTFTDVTKESGLGQPTSTQTAVWADIDNDGYLDLFVGNENGPAQLFHNNGDGTFKDISHAAGIDKVAFTKGVTAADYDNDGYVDLYVSNFGGDNFLYRNNHDGTFVDVAKQAGVLGPTRGFATWFFDYDNDGWPDLFVTSYFTSVEETARTYLGLPHNAPTLKLYKNLGTGAFRDVTQETGLDKVFMPMGGNFGDVDNDGYPDIYLGTGNPSYGSLTPNVLLHNQAGKRFVDITASSGTGELHKGHGVAFADVDNDGDEDILTVIGGAVPGDSHAFRLFENPGHGNDWISLRLVGVKSNRAAIGARIKLTVSNAGQGTRAIYRTAGSGGSFGASPLEQHIGIGKSGEIRKLEIWWPGTSGVDTGDAPQSFTNVPKNRALEIQEFARDYKKIERHPFRLGGTKKHAVATE